MPYPAIFSFFSGLGFLDLGFEDAGFPVVYVNEVYEPFLKAYYHSRRILNRPVPAYGNYLGSIEALVGDKQKVLSDLVAEARHDTQAVGFIGGPPCPDFSVGGKNRGRDGDVGRLSEAYVELIVQHRPDFFLFENVKGLWRTAKHRTFFEEIKSKLHQAGYITDERLINSIDYGAPQNRERIILVGFQRSFLREPIIGDGNVLPENSFPWLAFAPYRSKDVLALPWPTHDPFVEGDARQMPTGIISELTAEYWFSLNQVSQHPNAAHVFRPRAAITRFMTVDEGDDSRKSFKRLHRWRYSPTVAYGNNEVHIHPYFARRLSVSEALSLQSLPLNFELPSEMTLSAMFKGIGNGVPFLAARALACSVATFLGVNDETDETHGFRFGEGDQVAPNRQTIPLHR